MKLKSKTKPTDIDISRELLAQQSISGAARVLGITRATIYNRLQKYGFPELSASVVFKRACAHKVAKNTSEVQKVIRRADARNMALIQRELKQLDSSLKALRETPMVAAGVKGMFNDFNSFQDFCVMKVIDSLRLSLADIAALPGGLEFAERITNEYEAL